MASFEEFADEICQLESENEQWATFCRMGLIFLHELYIPFINMRTAPGGPRSGAIMISNALQNEDGSTCFTLFRMYPSIFIDFCDLLEAQYELKGTKDVAIHEQVGMFLFTIAHGASQRLVGAIFGVSPYTVNTHMNNVLQAINRLAAVNIQPHPLYNHGAPYHSPTNPRHYPFRGCVGAMDGTHVECVPPKKNRRVYCGRKGYPSQNILAICNFNLCFTFVFAGWEGSTHDSRMLTTVLQKHPEKFPHPRNGHYYLVDARFPNKEGFLDPYRGADVRYHFQEFDNATQRSRRRPQNAKECFNYLHSSCRNVIERAFGVWKARFAILQKMTSYNMKQQVSIVIATMSVHNFLRCKQSADATFVVVCDDVYNPPEDMDIPYAENYDVGPSSASEQRQWEEF